MRTGPEHYSEAERLIDEAKARMDWFPSGGYAQQMAEAQVHATLALAAATALARITEGGLPQPDRMAWYRAASTEARKFAERQS